MLYCKGSTGMLQAMSYDHDNLIPVFSEFGDPDAVTVTRPRPVEPQIIRHVPSWIQDAEDVREVASLERYEVKAPLGGGTYGRVYLVIDREGGRSLAMKVIRKRDILHQNAHDHLANELTISQLRINCPFVNNTALVFEGPKHHFLVSELLEGGELYYLIRDKGALNEPESRFYAAELLVALESLHANGVLYRDLKPENILLHADGHVGLVDFGLSKPNFHVGDSCRTLCGTAEYIAPEILAGDAYGFPVDAWGFGCVLYEMLVGTPPFYDTCQSVMNENIIFNTPKYPSSLSPCVVGLIEGLLNKSQSKRTTIAEAIRHPWFTGVDWGEVKRRSLKPPFIPKSMQAVINAMRKESETRKGSFRPNSFLQTP